MAQWEFKKLSLDEQRQPLLADLSKEQRQRARQYSLALQKAVMSKVSSPIFSDYHVKAAVGPVKGKFLPAGNVEYGYCAAIHAEETAVAAYRSRTNGHPDPQAPILALVSGTPGNVATPCGNCRDVLLDAFGPNLEIVSGAPDGGTAIVCKLRDYLFDDFTRLVAATDEPEIRMPLDYLNAQKRERITSDPYHSPTAAMERQYAALIAAHDGENNLMLHYGGRQVLCDYHPLYPLRDALRRMEHWRTTVIQFVTVVADGTSDTPPHVLYKDRQHLLEMHLRGEAIDGRNAWDPRVYLVAMNDKGENAAWRTSVKEWLPLPFSPKNFGPEFMERFAAYHRGKAASP